MRKEPRTIQSIVSTITLLMLFISTLAPATSFAQKRSGKASAAMNSSSVMPNFRRDAEVARMLAEIDARNIERTIRKLVSFGTRNTLSEQDNPARGIGAARDWIYSELLKIRADSGGRLIVDKQAYKQEKAPRVPQATMITNLVATLPGEQAASEHRLYVVSGHYDSMCTSPTDEKCDAPGANDDASGVAAMLEMARVMSKRKFDATIIFMAVAGEEQSLLGSTYFAEQAKQKSLNVEAMFTNDIIGNSLSMSGVRDRRTVRVFSEGVPTNETEAEANVRRGVGGENDSASRQLARFIKQAGEAYVPTMNVMMVYRRDRYLRGGDHIPFLERGFPAVRFTEPNENYNHQHQNVRIEGGVQFGDLPEFVDFAYIAQVARINAASLSTLALAPAMPKNVGLVTKRLTTDTDLQWDANKEPDLLGYEIVWRETTSPVWTNARMVGNVTSYTMQAMSKDNYFFGVRAVDKDGNRSPVSFPRPVR
jgi:acetylornithine deacetylase/succinyl-diaminopimelate desuccinylase-like protein